MRLSILTAFLTGLALVSSAHAQTRIGSVSTNFRVLGPDDKVIIDRFDDPLVPNVACYVSRAKTGGVTGAIGVASSPSTFSIACRKLGPGAMPVGLPNSKKVFSIPISMLFKSIDVTRIVDPQKQVLIYVAVSTKILNGSPFNSISVVPMGEGGQ